MSGLRKSGKRILYVLSKKTNCKLANFSFCGNEGMGGRGKAGEHAAYEVLCRLCKNGLVATTKYPDGNIYYLTDEGKEAARPIVKEVDNYKAW